VLPGLLEAAIETGQWRIARDLAAQFTDHAELHGSPAYHFLLGRAAETGADLLAAMDSYARAGNGGDLWAHRARVALVAMGLRSGTLEAREAMTLLAQVRQLWWGDAQARAVLRDLAVLQAAEGETLAALDSLGALINRYPISDEAGVARERARELIDSLYARGAAGEMPLAEFLAAHRRIAPDFRFDPNFAPAAERFADTFRAAGATRIAADEYGAIHDHLAVAQDLGLALVPPTRLDGLRLKAAEALIFGGRNEEAATMLRAGLLSDDPGLRDRFNTLAAELYSATGASDAVIETQVFVPTESYLRAKAVAYFDLGDWAGAERAYDQLFALYGPDLDFAVAVYLVLATFRNGHGAQAVAMARRFSELNEHPEWGGIVASLTDEAPELLPLRRDTAQRRIDNAARTLERLDPAVAPSN
jgi:tetratricopeptide (TPR) repeat protein